MFVSLFLPYQTISWVLVAPPTSRHCQQHHHGRLFTTCHASKRPVPFGHDELSRRVLSSRRDWLATATVTTTAAVLGLVSKPPSTYADAETPSYAGQTATATIPGMTTTTLTRKSVSTLHTCDGSVSVWQQPVTGRKVYLVGTAHISIASAELVGDVIDDVRPDAVFVELDAKRVRRSMSTTGSSTIATTKPTTSNTRSEEPGGLVLPTKSNDQVLTGPDTPLPASSSSGSSSGMSKQALSFGSAAVGSAIKGMYGKLGNAGFKPGEEFVIAVREGQEVGAMVILGDRDVEVTLRRLSEALRQTDLLALLSQNSELEASMKALLPNDLMMDSSSDNFKNELTAYVEIMKTKENVKAIMGQLKRVAPEIYQAMVAERDVYMANGLDKLNAFPVIVAVMGIAHVDGVETYLKSKGWAPVKLNCKN